MIDKMMKKYGYGKTEESYHGAYYKKREQKPTCLWGKNVELVFILFNE